MSDIRIPFLQVWKDKMLAGIKTHTCRSECYGTPGDRFKQYGAVFELVAVWQTTLKDVAMNYYQQEGCESPQAYIQVWNDIHPRRKYVPTDIKWLHHFRRVT